jgi:serine/threonine protein kinase
MSFHCVCPCATRSRCRYSQDDTCYSSAGSPAFQAPELAAGAESFSGFAVDVWAAGVTLWNMASGTYPFEGETIFALYANIARVCLARGVVWNRVP